MPQVSGRARPGARLSQPRAVEHVGRSQGWAHTRGLAQGFLLVGPGSCLKGRWPNVSRRPVDGLGQPMPADGVKWLAGALGHVCSTSPSFWADSRGRLVPAVGGGWLSFCIGAGAELSHPLLSPNSRSSFLLLPETDALGGVVRRHPHQQPEGQHLPLGGGGSRAQGHLPPSPPSPLLPRRKGQARPKLAPFPFQGLGPPPAPRCG